LKGTPTSNNCKKQALELRLLFNNTCLLNTRCRGEKMSLPSLAPIPPANVRLSLEHAEWEACLDAWFALAELHMKTRLYNTTPVSTFLQSYYHELAHLDPNDATLRSPKADSLRKIAFALTRKACSEAGDVEELLQWEFLSNFCRVHVKSTRLPELLANLWRSKPDDLQMVLQKRKDALITMLDSATPDVAEVTLGQLAPIMRVSPETAIYFMTGTDLVDSMISGYGKAGADKTRKAISMTVYLGLVACVAGETPNFSLLSDHLYTLKSQGESKPPYQALVADAVTNTPLLAKLRRSASEKAPDRLIKLLDSLETFRSPSIARPKKHTRRKASSKGKARQTREDHEIHIHRMSYVTQVQDLFPDLGAGFVMKLLDEYNDDVEQVTAHLLDDSLPPHLQSLDRSEQAPIFDSSTQADIDHLAPRSTPPPSEPFIPERRNVYDNDELDTMDASRLHFGKRKETTNPAGTTNKSAILSALAAFDADDDERDDTYDAQDVGGSIDNAHPDGEPGQTAKVTQEENDMALFTSYKTSPELFGRTFDVRRGQARAALKAETGMTDEAIEGWAIMLQRDPRRLNRLESQLGAFDGRQGALARSSYRESPAGTETEDSDAPGGRGGFGGRGRGGARGRGRGGRGGRGGNVSGPSGDASTVAAQKRKEANKSSQANHNRKAQRGKKMARGGFPG
jgi:activating signal cointegrator complex subunit 2